MPGTNYPGGGYPGEYYPQTSVDATVTPLAAVALAIALVSSLAIGSTVSPPAAPQLQTAPPPTLSVGSTTAALVAVQALIPAAATTTVDASLAPLAALDVQAPFPPDLSVGANAGAPAAVALLVAEPGDAQVGSVALAPIAGQLAMASVPAITTVVIDTTAEISASAALCIACDPTATAEVVVPPRGIGGVSGRAPARRTPITRPPPPARTVQVTPATALSLVIALLPKPDGERRPSEALVASVLPDWLE